ncbi:MAG: hypothetical protein H6R02_2388 [Burkholderiaceae bacterium]|nr:hypothetical protein [Burkholderiaceae bacterium]
MVTPRGQAVLRRFGVADEQLAAIRFEVSFPGEATAVSGDRAEATHDPRSSILIGQHTLAGLIPCRLPATQEHAILGMSLKTIEPRQVRPKPPRQRAA